MENGMENERKQRLLAARESFSGRLLTNSQFAEAIAITGIIEREIRKSGTFKEKLGDYAYAFARSERFDAMKAETIVRDLFKERYGLSMNQLREALVEREDKITDQERARAYRDAIDIEGIVRTGDKITFTRAYAAQAERLADEIGVTQACARTLMSEQFGTIEGIAIQDWGKELDAENYQAQVEREKAQRAAQEADPKPSRAMGRANGAARGRTGPSVDR